MRFNIPDTDEAVVADDEGYECGVLKRTVSGWKFESVPGDVFTTSELRAIADELDKRNGDG